MAYTVKYTDYINKGALTVNDSTVNTETSLALPGRNQRGYGIAVAENFLHILEHFANTTPPANPVEGQVWYDTTPGVEDLKIYDGTTWKLAGSIRKSADTPEVGVLGDLWVDTDNQQLFLFNGSSWILVGPTFSSGLKTGVVAETVLDINDLTKTILATYVNDEIISIYSIETFIPKVTIQGFSTIKSGINLSVKDFDNDTVIDTKFWGTSEKAENLIVGGTVVASSNFLRKDTSNITDYGFTVRNNQGVSTGLESQLRLYVDPARTGAIYHSTPDSAFDLRINFGGEVTTLLRADSNGNIGLGINNLAPAYTLDVLGDSRFTDVVKIESAQNTLNDVTGALQVTGGVLIKKDLIVRGDSNFTGKITVGESPVGTNNIAILPQTDNTYDIGYQNPTTPTDRNRFRNVYATTFYGNIVGNVVGNITGNLNGSATRLLSSTTFSVVGDVTSPGFSFDGGTTAVSAGAFVTGQQYKISDLGTTNFTLIGAASNTVGLVFTATGPGIGTGVATTVDSKVFSATISPNFITDKIELTAPDGSDELLLYRSVNGTLGKMSRTTFFQQVPLVPVGAIFPYAGDTPPNGYLFCDGSEKSRIDYIALFTIIGYTYGDPAFLQGTTTFRLPDLRGKFPLGKNNMDNADSIQTNSGIIDSSTQAATGSTQSTAGVLGNANGSETVTLNTANIPNHKHDFIGDDGTLFYATNNDTGTPSDTGAFVGNGPDAVSSGQYIGTTGNMIGRTSPTTPFTVMNPYLTINYIIFTGRFE